MCLGLRKERIVCSMAVPSAVRSKQLKAVWQQRRAPPAPPNMKTVDCCCCCCSTECITRRHDDRILPPQYPSAIVHSHTLREKQLHNFQAKKKERKIHKLEWGARKKVSTFQKFLQGIQFLFAVGKISILIYNLSFDCRDTIIEIPTELYWMKQLQTKECFVTEQSPWLVRTEASERYLLASRHSYERTIFCA